MIFTIEHKVFKEGQRPVLLESLKALYDDFFVELILKLKPGEKIETDFRIIRRVI